MPGLAPSFGAGPGGRWIAVLAAVLLVTAIVAPLRTAREWRGAWRVTALLPLAALLLLLVRAALGVAQQPGAHRLLPVEVLLASLGAIMLTALLRLLHALARTDEAE